MTNQTLTPVSEPTPTLQHKSYFPWAGIVLVILGIVFLLRQFKIDFLQNWWALFILIPALGSLSSAWAAWRKSGKFNSVARSALGGGLVILTVALMFLFSLNWIIYWPLMLIVPGFSMLLGAIPDKEMEDHKNLHHFAGLGIWFGIAAMLLGGAFLFKNLSPDLFMKLFGSFRWYGLFVIIPAIGAIVNGFILFRENGNHFNLASKVLLGIGLLMFVIAGFILSTLQWNALYAVILIAVGIIVMLTAWLK